MKKPKEPKKPTAPKFADEFHFEKVEEFKIEDKSPLKDLISKLSVYDLSKDHVVTSTHSALGIYSKHKKKLSAKEQSRREKLVEEYNLGMKEYFEKLESYKKDITEYLDWALKNKLDAANAGD